MASVAQTPQDVPEWRRPADQGPNSRQHRTSTREGNRGNRGGRGGGRGGNGGGPSRKDSTMASQNTIVSASKLVVDPPTATNTPAEPSPTPKPNSRPKPTRGYSVTASEDSASVSSQTSTRPPNRRRRSQQGKPPTTSSNTPSKLLNVQTLNQKAPTGPSSPNPAKDLPPHLATATSTTTSAELKSDIDALVERVRTVAMDRPHTPGSHIDWADDDDSLPDLNDWGYTEDMTTSVQPEEHPTSIPPIPEDVPLQSIIPEVKIEGEPSPDEKSQDARAEPVSDAMPRTHRVQKTRSRRGTRSRGNSRTQQLPPAPNITDLVSQGSSLSPTQPTDTIAVPHSSKPQGPKRQNSNQGQNSQNNQGQTNSRDNGRGNGGGRQRGQNGATVATPTRNSFPLKTGPKANHTPPVQSQAPAQGPDIAHSVTNSAIEADSKPLESKGERIPDDERKKGKSIRTPRKAETNDPNPTQTATNSTPHELDPTHNDVKSSSPHNRNNNKRNSYDPSHSRSHTYGGRTQGGPQPHSAPTPDFPHHSSNTNPTSPTSRNPRSPDLRQSPGMRPSGLGPVPRSAGYERHNRNHSSPSGVGGATRPPHQTRPVLTGDALSRLARSLGSAPGSPKKEPPVPPPAS
ncbi:hypothetical protein BDM02DRAFT_3111034 [Thelephora ganbajun]|uniref:Uncharacterized protein n=1 Tax=Thelephora ganbajun TaxID=370292 RepID=A0ACB6ZQ66_THEGA|nr:hypothetical protein BDM02DRAFT_3111034 [Thelephora ganbajun]